MLTGGRERSLRESASQQTDGGGQRGSVALHGPALHHSPLRSHLGRSPGRPEKGFCETGTALRRWNAHVLVSPCTAPDVVAMCAGKFPGRRHGAKQHEGLCDVAAEERDGSSLHPGGAGEADAFIKLISHVGCRLDCDSILFFFLCRSISDQTSVARRRFSSSAKC